MICSLLWNTLILSMIIYHSVSIYDVPSYYGHWSRIFFQPQKINESQFTIFEFHYSVDLDYSNKTLYYANRFENCIEKYQFNTGKIELVAGKCGKPGNLIGETNISMFNDPSSLAYYQPNTNAINQYSHRRTDIVKNTTCDIFSASCILTKPYPPLTLENIRITPNQIQFPTISNNEEQYLYITDRNNHCIKRIQLRNKLVDIIAGQCGQPGFLDGPQGYNRLNSPSNIGVNSNGTIFFFDQGNQYMRKITKNGSVSTLLNGSCKQYGISRKVQNYVLKNIICYENWVEGITKSSNQHAFNNSILQLLY